MPHTRYTALLVDDEEAASQRLTHLLSEHPMIRVTGTLKSVSEAKAFLEREGVQAPDLIFLDVEMPGGTGMMLLPFVPADTRVIFVTAYLEHAASAFDIGALDYLVKPVESLRLEKALVRFLKERGIHGTGGALGSESVKSLPGELLNLPALDPESNETHLIPTESIRWIEGMQNYSRVMTKGGAVAAVFRRSLAEWESILPEGEFFRIGRSRIIRLPSLHRTKWVSRDETYLFFEGVEEPLVIGRSSAARLKDRLKGD